MTTTTTRHDDRWHRDGEHVSLLRNRPAPRPVAFDAQPDPVRIDMARAAFVIVDMQNDFLSDGGWFPERGTDPAPLLEIVPRLNAVADAFRKMGAPVIHLNWGVRADVANLPANVLDKATGCGARPGYGDEIGTGPVLVEGSWGAASHPLITGRPGDMAISKHRLSGFRDNELDQVLRRHGIETLFYAGVNLDRCVFATLMDGCFQGYDAVLVQDATTTVSPAEVGEAILYIIRLLYGFTTNSADLLRALDTPDKE